MPIRGAENAEIGCRIGAKSGAAIRRNHLPLSTEITCRFAPIFATVAAAKAGIDAWLRFYNEERQHQSHGYHTPRQIYEESLWICGRSALPTGCASPASRASSESREMLAFAHIPTGATTNRRIDQKGFEGTVTRAATAIGADIEIRRATP